MAFNWKIKAPQYDKLECKFDLLDTTALVIKSFYNEQEFVRISYLVTHKFKDNELNENTPEDFQYE